MSEILLWIYIVNATLLIVHEIDSAYWKEWELFRLPGGVGFFLILHIFLVFILLAGLLWLYQGSTAGLVLSFVLGLAGVTAFSIHRWFIKKGHPEFKTRVSQSILVSTLVISIIQLAATFYVAITI